jgi:pimeloyl-ACP methyl ester carboxylesterase
MTRRRLRLAVLSLCLSLSLATLAPLVVSTPASAADGRHIAGTTANGAWVLDIPAVFNGTLLLWSHGYTFTPVGAADAPSVATRDALLAEGFALAGSSYRNGGAGWAVNDGVASGRELVGIAKRQIGSARVTRVYAWGNSLGGLITQTLAERDPRLVDGVAPLCGVLGGTNKNLDLALDVAVAIKTFFAPQLRLRGYTSAAQAQAHVDMAMKIILARLADPSAQPSTAARLLGITAITAASSKTKDFSGSSLNSAVAAAVETIQTALTYATVGRYDIEQRVGGNPSSNIGADYTKRVTPTAVARFQAFGFAPGLLRAYAKTLQAFGRRVSANKAARVRADGLGNPTGRLRDKTVTMHTLYDPLVLVQNERVFATRVHAAGRSGRLHQLWVVPPASYTDGSPAVSTDGAPYGAGHCNFATSDYLAAVHTLDGWVRSGSYTAPAEVGGLRNSLAVSTWPAR